MVCLTSSVELVTIGVRFFCLLVHYSVVHPGVFFFWGLWFVGFNRRFCLPVWFVRRVSGVVFVSFFFSCVFGILPICPVGFSFFLYFSIIVLFWGFVRSSFRILYFLLAVPGEDLILGVVCLSLFGCFWG